MIPKLKAAMRCNAATGQREMQSLGRRLRTAPQHSSAPGDARHLEVEQTSDGDFDRLVDELRALGFDF
jgi:hypothetical protein